MSLAGGAMTPEWVEPWLVELLHDRVLRLHGGARGLRDRGLLESALQRPETLALYADPPPTLHDMAAAYAFGLARGMPFIDGNKRTAWVVCRTFLSLNGAELAGPDQATRYLAVLGLAEGRLSEQQFAKWLRDNCR